MGISAATFTAFTVGICAVTLVSAKGPTTKLTITGGRLQSPIELTSPSALVNVWGDEFIGAASAEPAAELPRYQVAFHVLPNGKRESQILYVVSYAHDSASGEAFIYLPGAGEQHHALNVSTILRAGRDGRWHRAATAWAQAVNRSLPR